jgi:hypothetical protein
MTSYRPMLTHEVTSEDAPDDAPDENPPLDDSGPEPSDTLLNNAAKVSRTTSLPPGDIC